MPTSIPTSTTDSPTASDRPGQKRRFRAAAVLASVVAATVTWVVAVAAVGVELTVERWDGAGTMTVSLPLVITTALIAGLAGWAALAVLERISPRRARAVWTVGASAVLLVSLGMPVTAAATTAAAITFVALHIVVGATLIPALARSTR